MVHVKWFFFLWFFKKSHSQKWDASVLVWPKGTWWQRCLPFSSFEVRKTAFLRVPPDVTAPIWRDPTASEHQQQNMTAGSCCCSRQLMTRWQSHTAKISFSLRLLIAVESLTRHIPQKKHSRWRKISSPLWGHKEWERRKEGNIALVCIEGSMRLTSCPLSPSQPPLELMPVTVFF